MAWMRAVVISGIASLAVAAPAAAAVQKVRFDVVGRTAAAGPQGAGSVSYYAPTKTLYVANKAAKRIDLFDLSDPANPVAKPPIAINLTGFSSNVPTSVATSTACGGIIAVSVPSQWRTESGAVALYRPDGTPIYGGPNVPAGQPLYFSAGRQPKHIAFLPGRHALAIAAEAPPGNTAPGVPGSDSSGHVYNVQWKGCVPTGRRIVEAPRGGPLPIDADVRRFPNGEPTDPSGWDADFEPEFVTSTGDGRRAYVSLQENNAVAVVDASIGRTQSVRSVGFTDHGLPGNELDASDVDGVDIRSWPNVFGMRQPSAIAAYQVEGKTYVVTANQGAPRDYAFQTESHRVKGLPLDPTAFPNAASLQKDANLGRLRVSTLMGDTDKDGDYDQLYAFGGRSISILDADATPIWDSGAALEQWTAANQPGLFNRGNNAGSAADSRSDDMGPEPKAITTGLVSGRRYAFLGAAQQGSLFAWDLSDKPGEASIAGHVNTRDTDLAPDAVRFIPRYDSPNGRNLVLLTNARTGTTTIYAVKVTR